MTTSKMTTITDASPVVGTGDDSSMTTDNSNNNDNENTVRETPTPTTTIPTTTCHVLPCNIEYTGMAHTHVHFSPVSMSEQDWEDGKDCHAATFRGLGLLAMKKNEYNNNANCDKSSNNNNKTGLQGAVFAIDGHNIKVKAKFDHMLEWHHEHNLQSVRYAANRTSTEQPTMNRIRMAHEWSQIAQVLHEPLAVE